MVKMQKQGIEKVGLWFVATILCLFVSAAIRLGKPLLEKIKFLKAIWKPIKNTFLLLTKADQVLFASKPFFAWMLLLLGIALIGGLLYMAIPYLPKKKKAVSAASKKLSLLNIFILILGTMCVLLGALMIVSLGFYPFEIVKAFLRLCAVATIVCLSLLIRVIRDVYVKRNSEDYVYFEQHKKSVLIKTSLLGICLVGLPLWIPDFWGFTIGQPLVLEQKELLEVYVAVLSLTFVSISVMSMLSDKSVVIYWEDIATRKLIKPVFGSFAAYTYYSVGAALGAGISATAGNTSAFLVFCLADLISLVFLTYTMVDVYYDRESKKARMLQDLQEDAADYLWVEENIRLSESRYEEKRRAEHLINKETGMPYTQREIRDKMVGHHNYKDKILLLIQNFIRAREQHEVRTLQEIYELYLYNPAHFPTPEGARVLKTLLSNISDETQPLLIDTLTTRMDRHIESQGRTEDPFAPGRTHWEEDKNLWISFPQSQHLGNLVKNAGGDTIGDTDLHNFILQVVRRMLILYNDMVTHANLKAGSNAYDYMIVPKTYQHMDIRTEAAEKPNPAQVAEVFDACFEKMIPESLFPTALMLVMGIILENVNENERHRLISLFWDFPLLNCFTPYLGCIFEDDASPAALLWKELFPEK